MITIENYFNEFDSFRDFINSEGSLLAAHDFLIRATDGGKNFDTYYSSDKIRNTIDIFLSQINESLNNPQKENTKEKKSKTETKSPKQKTSTRPLLAKILQLDVEEYADVDKEDLQEMYNTLVALEKDQGLTEELKTKKYELFQELSVRDLEPDEDWVHRGDDPPETRNPNNVTWRIDFRDLNKMTDQGLRKELQKTYDVEAWNGLTPKEKKYRDKIEKLLQKFTPTTFVEKIPEELRFIKRFVQLNGKSKTKDDILRFINSLQKAIVEKRIRRTSTWADKISIVQNKLIEWYNNMKQKISINIEKEDFYNELKSLVKSEVLMPSINYIKRYISLNGKTGVKEKAKQLLKQINQAFEKKKLTDSDLYISAINDIKRNLENFLSNSGEKTLEIEKAELNGLEGILGCACQNLNGMDGKPSIMNSMDFAEMEFDTLGFTGKWLRLIGDPSSNFSAMVFGKPKMGKSYLCVDFAGYLARYHGKVLYVAKEEGLNMTLQEKLNDKHVGHPNLFVASVLPFDLSKYDFIFLDSVNRMGLTPDDLNNLKAKNPSKSFIFVFQSTKDGKFRGENAFQHDVDVVIEVPEKGKAVQMGRFNQGGEIDIFSHRAVAGLEFEGTKKSKDRSKKSFVSGRRKTVDKPQPFFYVIDLNERGSFRAHVEDYLGNSVFEIRAGDELEEGETSIFEDGFMRNAEDTIGLKDYLINLGIIGKDDWVSRSTQYKESRFKNYNSKRYFR